MSEADSLDENATRFLHRSLLRGNVVLFTGAGFSRSAGNKTGGLPSGWELREALWPLAFPSSEPDERSSLGDVFEVAMRTNGNQTQELLRGLLTVEFSKVPEFYETYLRFPWHRIYTLNLDNLLRVCLQKFDLPNDLVFSSALGGDTLPQQSAIAVVHLNGELADLPNVTFGAEQYGERSARPDPGYVALVRDIVSRPVVFVGTELEEPPLWHYIALRGDKPPGRELRPRSYLVSPSLPRARRAILERFNVTFVPLDAEEFAAKYLAPIVDQAPPKASVALPPPTSPFEDVSAAAEVSIPDLSDFLLGREPEWADVIQGYAIERTFESQLVDKVLDPSVRINLVTGTAGSGKSTTLRRMALTAQAAGDKVLWLRREATQSLTQIRANALTSDANLVVIDGADRFGANGVDLVKALVERSAELRVLVSYSSPAASNLDVLASLGSAVSHHTEVPNLSDVDIDGLLAALTTANRLGALAGRSPAQQKAEFRERARRQLLVALLEATSGRRFEDKIDDECAAMSANVAAAYAVVALATRHHYSMRREDVLAAIADVSSTGVELIDSLVRGRLIVLTGAGRLLARHSVIAQQALVYFRSSGQLGQAIQRLAFVLSAKMYPNIRRTQERRLLTTLISHDYLHNALADRAAVRAVYEEIEQTQRTDPHYWLQRGSYELEQGDILLAENFLLQARGLASGDYMVETEWAYLLLKRACREPAHLRAQEWADAALEILLNVVTDFGQRTPNTYVILGQQGATWARVGGISLDKKKELLLELRVVLREGAMLHGANKQVLGARDEVEKAYLELSAQR